MSVATTVSIFAKCTVSELNSSDVRVHRLSEFQRLLDDAAKDATPVSEPVATIALSARPVWLRLAMGEERLFVALEDGRGALLFRLSDVTSGNVRRLSEQVTTKH